MVRKVGLVVGAIVLLAVAALLLFGCGKTDHGGYATQDEGCKAIGGTITAGPTIEGDEVEYTCTLPNKTSKLIEAPRDAVRGPNAKNHTNAWGVDEDTLVCPDGTEIPTGDEANTNYGGEVVGCRGHGIE